MTLVHFCLFEKYAPLEIDDEKNDNNIKKIDKIHLVIGNTFRPCLYIYRHFSGFARLCFFLVVLQNNFQSYRNKLLP